MHNLTKVEDIKVFALYLLDNAGMPLELSKITGIVMQDDFVGILEFLDCFMDLVDNGNIEMNKQPSGEPTYAISSKGRESVRELRNMLPGFIRARTAKSALRYLSFDKRGATLTSMIENDGKNMVYTAKITEKGDDVFTLSFAFENDYQLQIMKHNFDEDPDFYYKAIMSLLLGDTKRYNS